MDTQIRILPVGRVGKTVYVGINGKLAAFAVNQIITVPDEVLAIIRDAGIAYAEGDDIQYDSPIDPLLAAARSATLDALQAARDTQQTTPKSFLAKLPANRIDEAMSGTLPASFDATGYLQEALDEYAGQVVVMPRGKLYIRQALFIPSGTSLRLDNTVLVADYANWIDSGIADALYGMPGVDNDTGFFLVNQNYASPTIIDKDIEIIGGNFIRGPGEKSGHAIMMRRVERVLVDRIYAAYGANGTAMLACKDTTVVNSSAYNTYNAGFDHWDGAGFAKIANLTVVCDHNDTQQGIQFTGQPTSPADGADSAVISGSNIQCKGIFNAASGQASAFIANALNDASSVKLGNFSSVVIDGCDNGIVLQGDVRGIRIDAVVKGATNQPVTFLPNSEVQTEVPSGNVVDVTLVDCAAQYALVGIQGTDNVVTMETVGTNTGIVTVQFFAAASGNRVYGEEGMVAADVSPGKTNQLMTAAVRSYSAAGQTVLSPAFPDGQHDIFISPVGNAAKAGLRAPVITLEASASGIGLIAGNVPVGIISQFGMSLLAGKSFAIDNVALLEGHLSGFGTPVGAELVSNYNANTATPLQTNQLLAQLLVCFINGLVPKA